MKHGYMFELGEILATLADVRLDWGELEFEAFELAEYARKTANTLGEDSKTADLDRSIARSAQKRADRRFHEYTFAVNLFVKLGVFESERAGSDAVAHYILDHGLC